MDILSQIGAGPWLLAYGFAVALLAGLVKGMVGFAMPMILISGLGSVVAPDLALAWLILPALVTNIWQALRQGVGAALGSMHKFRVFLLVGLVFLAGSAQLVAFLPGALMLLLIGVPMTIYAAANLAGRPLRLPANPGRAIEGGAGAVAGFFGGISGVWAPPTVALLIALDTEKTEQIRVQGVIYAVGGVTLLAAHMASGVFNAQTAPMSAVLVIPAMLGIWLGFAIQDRIDQATFRKLTLIVLLIAGLNLVRRGVAGF